MHERRDVIAPVSEELAQIVEQLALHVAEHYQGRITPHHLMPYLPVSLELIRACLDAMVDGQTVCTVPGEHFAVYEFTAYRARAARAGVLHLHSCPTCGTELSPGGMRVLCPACAEGLHKALQRRPKHKDRISQAVREHDILYTAAQHADPLPAATLASRSRLRLQPLHQTLERLALEGFLYQEVDPETGAVLYGFPSIAYPQERYRANRAVMKSWARGVAARPWHKRAPLLGLLSFLTLASLGYWYTALLSPQHHPVTRPESIQPQPRSAPPAPPPTQTLPPSPLYGKAYHEDAMKHATPVQVSLRQNGFVPVGMTVAASWNTPTLLSPVPPPRIIKEPAYQGSSQRYGVLKLGTMANALYDFVFDLIAGPHPVLYFDANQNGDLTDDGKPLINQGTGIFATRIDLPWQRLIKEVTFPGQFQLWFFTNDALWKQGSVAHYSRTQLKGTVHVAGKTYLAYIADARDNDADFTNDGIAIDVNGDGEIDRDREVFPPQQVAHIHGKDYVFRITW